MTDDVMKVDWGDGVSALDRTQRVLVMATSAAIHRMEKRGHRRKNISVTLAEPGDKDPILLHISLYGNRVFEVRAEVIQVGNEAMIGITNHWLTTIPAKGWRRLLFWRK